jgi:hypothetical protein
MKQKARHKYKIGCWYHSEDTWRYRDITDLPCIYIMKFLSNSYEDCVRIRFYPIDKDFGNIFELTYEWNYIDAQNFRKITKKEAFMYVL